MSNPFYVVKRDGSQVVFESEKIRVAASKAVLDTRREGETQTLTQEERDRVHGIPQVVAAKLQVHGNVFDIEDVQDAVEAAMMEQGLYAAAKAYVLYRHQRDQERKQQAPKAERKLPNVQVGEELKPLDLQMLERVLADAKANLQRPELVDTNKVLEDTLRNLYEGVTLEEVFKSILLSARAKVELEPEYSYFTAQLLLQQLTREVLGRQVSASDLDAVTAKYFSEYLVKGVQAGLLNPVMADSTVFDHQSLAEALDTSRDANLDYLGAQTLYDRYLLHIEGQRIETVQIMLMRVAMGVSLNEDNPTARAIEFYNLLSSFDYMSSTPTLFNSGTQHSQLSSCYLSTVPDDLAGIYDAFKDNALLSKFAGGLGNDWSNVRALRSHIKGTNGESQGIVPFLKVLNDTAVAVNQGGKRKGAVCAYIETWHLDIEEFLELRKNTGDERRRTHDMNTANWIPDLFMKRVISGGTWTLFSPSDVPDLHSLYGREFETRYEHYERLAQAGEIKLHKVMPATDLWRKMLSMLFETGHPWLTFKDPCNIRSPQQHVGVVHSSNLCTEITLNTNEDEIAVCNLGSVNLAQHIVDGAIDEQKLQRTVTSAMRMLDNVIDVNFYPVDKARNSNMRHRPVGLGMMGLQDALYLMDIPFGSVEAVEFNDKVSELVAYFAYSASSDLAAERGTYESFEGSTWSKGEMPLDTQFNLSVERGSDFCDFDFTQTLDWDALRSKIKQQGMRNSNCLAIAPTATIANITGVNPCIEPAYRNLYVKSNLSGEFTVVNRHLVEDLKAHGIWDTVMVADLKHSEGSVQGIDRVPAELKAKYRIAFEIEPEWVVRAAARRQKWIDQSQSVNIFMAGVSGRRLDETYKLAWKLGLKTTYYLRASSATNAEHSTGTGGELNAVSGTSSAPAFATPAATIPPMPASMICSLENPDNCEACE